MNTYKLIYEDGREVVVIAHNALELVKQYDLASRNNVNTKIVQLGGTFVPETA